MVYAVLVIPVAITHLIPGLVLFLPWIFCVMAPPAFVVFVPVFFLSYATAKCRTTERRYGDTALGLYHIYSLKYKTGFGTQAFNFVRIAVGVIVANILGSYMMSLPVNWMTLIYTKQLPIAGVGYVDIVFEELNLRSQACYYLQMYSSFLSSLDFIVRLF